MSINKINRVVIHDELLRELDDMATKQELQSTKDELINSMNEVYQGISWKPTVATYDDLRVAYPDAKDGWTATVGDTDITYQYDLETDTWFATSINALPLATSSVDGLMAKKDKEKLDTVQLNAQKNLTTLQVLEQIKTVDGVGSGLDADLFQGKVPGNFANKEHDHNGLYYGKSEVNIFLNDKAPKNHVHSKGQITDFEHGHSANEIIENSNKRFVSDVEKANLSDANSKKHIHENKSILDKITQGLLDKWNSAWEHITDTVKHITSTERTKWNTVDDKVDKVTGKGLSDENYTLIEKNKLKDIAIGATKNDTDSNLKNRANHTGTQLSSTISDFADTVRSTVLVGLSTTTNAVITVTDTILSALGKLQKQITDNLTRLDSHIGNKNNPHEVTKSDVNLGSVENYGIATQIESESGTSNSKYMTPLRTKQAIDKFKPKKISELENDKNYVTSSELGSAGYGDMTKGVYDKNNNGIVDRAEIADNVQWDGVIGKPTSLPADGGFADGFYMKDTRNVNDSPRDLLDKKTTGMFKLRTSVGNPPVGSSVTYVFIINVIGWSVAEGSGGWPIQIAVGKEGLAFRQGVNADTWSSWSKMANIEDIPISLSQLIRDINFDERYYTEGEIDIKLNTKVDKVSGKQLSTEDYSTAEKNKLRDIQAGANNYTHPATHPVDMIVGLHSVSKSGNYNELNGKPTKISQFENDIKSYHKGITPPTNTNLLWIKTIAK